MKPGISPDRRDTRPRKSSLIDSAIPVADRPNASPTTFFLTRESELTKPVLERPDQSQSNIKLVSTLQEAVEEAEQRSKHTTPRISEHDRRSGSRRRSTIKPSNSEKLAGNSFNVNVERPQSIPDRSSTPSPLASQAASSPSSPKSISSRSIQKSEDDSMNDDTESQAIVSGEEDEEEIAAVIQDSQPELIMPSIKMPSRRPFTARGKGLGMFKILVTGGKGIGKTSLIKSIVQLCEDIVHVDPLSTNSNSLNHSLSSYERQFRQQNEIRINEIYASTKPYPSWWSDVDESKILRRRKSMGDSVLERNICFVETLGSSKHERTIHYLEQQLSKAIASTAHMSSDFSGLLSGRGGTQVDLILYLINKDTLKDDYDFINQLSELSNVIPLIGKSDLLTPEEQKEIKEANDFSFLPLLKLPAFFTAKAESSFTAVAPYLVSSANGPDTDTMDASLLMSPEYVQPLLPSELNLLVDQIFEPDTVAYLRHTAAKKLMTWHAKHPRLLQTPSPSSPSARHSTLTSPPPTSLSNSGIFLPPESELSLNTSNSYALAKVADHTQRAERLAQVRLSKWASDLQISLQRERERYEKLARNERAIWLVERMGEELRDGQIMPFDKSQALARIANDRGDDTLPFLIERPVIYQVNDPLGLLRWRETMRIRSWIALQVVGGFGVVGGLALWMAKTWGLTTALHEWVQEWSSGWFGQE